MDIFGSKDDNGSIYEYVTITSQKFPIDITTIAATIHLKVLFYDNIDNNQLNALKVSAFIVETDKTVPTTTNLNGMYEGYVRKDQVATSSQYLYDKVIAQSTTIDNNELIRVWLQEARAALTRCVSSDVSNAAKYMYYLQQVKKEVNNDLSQLVMLTWKIKHPFGQITLGAVELLKTSEDLMEQVSVLFIEPLICSLTAERRHHEQAGNIAAKNSDQLLNDNQKLLSQLQLVAESRQRDDQRLIARFIEVLNTKKLHLANIKNELSELKNQHNISMPTDGEEENVTKLFDRRNCGRGRGKAKSNVVLNKGQTTESKSVVKRKRQHSIQHDHINTSLTSERDNQRIDNNVILENTNTAIQHQKQDLMEINTVSHVSTVENIIVDVEAAAVASVDVNMLGNNNCFTCDTQIDDILEGENTSNQLNTIEPMTTTTTSNIPSMLSNFDNNHQIPKKKTVLDDLWSGIL